MHRRSNSDLLPLDPKHYLDERRLKLIKLRWTIKTLIDIVKAIHTRMRYLKGENQLWEIVEDHH